MGVNVPLSITNIPLLPHINNGFIHFTDYVTAPTNYQHLNKEPVLPKISEEVIFHNKKIN